MLYGGLTVYIILISKNNQIQDVPPPEDNKPHSLIVTEDVQEVNLHVQADLSNTDIQATKSASIARNSSILLKRTWSKHGECEPRIKTDCGDIVKLGGPELKKICCKEKTCLVRGVLASNVKQSYVFHLRAII